MKIVQNFLFINFGLACLLLGGPLLSRAQRFDDGKLMVLVKCNQEILRYNIQTVFLLPQEKVTLEITDKQIAEQYHLLIKGKRIRFELAETGKWLADAPEKSGLYQVRLVSNKANEPLVQINIVVMLSFEQLKFGRLQGCRIGRYPEARTIRDIYYAPPKGFIRVTPGNQETWISPHFQLKQFLCKESKAFPQFIVVDEGLLLKLERVLERFNQYGYRTATLEILSGYRSPYYNHQIGNVAYSCHQWGMAADILVNDLNHDGFVNGLDAQIFAMVVEEVEQSEKDVKIGGLGIYGKTHAHNPFVHLDVRGTYARWGLELTKTTLRRRAKDTL